jgi:hypothetical protein
MPFGMGYYGWPWDKPIARTAMQAFVFGVPLYAATGCIASISPKLSPFRLVFAVCALVVGLFGVASMSHWLSVYPGAPAKG